MIIVHHLNNSRSQRVLWLLEELGAPYEIRPYQRNAETMLAPPELKAVHPLGKSPVLEDGPIRIAETGAIVEYLIDTHGQGRMRPPSGTEEGRRYTYWLHHAEGSAMPPLLMRLVFSITPAKVPALIRPIAKGIFSKLDARLVQPNLSALSQFWEDELGRSTWFAGDDLTGADIMMSFPVEATAMRTGYLNGKPRLAAFLERVHARPAWQRALQRGGDYDFG